MGSPAPAPAIAKVIPFPVRATREGPIAPAALPRPAMHPEATALPAALPPFIPPALGYEGDRRFVAFFVHPEGLAIDDGTCLRLVTAERDRLGCQRRFARMLRSLPISTALPGRRFGDGRLTAAEVDMLLIDRVTGEACALPGPVAMKWLIDHVDHEETELEAALALDAFDAWMQAPLADW
jgi:hypothetical protein